MTSVLDYNDIKNELIYYLRNSDIYSITERNVTTTTDTGAFSSDSTHLINKSNIKNIRSIVVDGTTLTYGNDYTYNNYYNDSGTRKTKISFNTAQTGDYTITYDYGTDIMFTDFPRVDLNVSSFPRLALDIIGDDSEENELNGDTKTTTLTFAVYIYDSTTEDIDTKFTAVKEALISNQKDFYNLRYVRRLSTGPILFFGNQKNNIKQRNIDFIAPYNIETA